MATGDIRTYACNYPTKHGSTSIASSRSVSVQCSSVVFADPGKAGAPGLAEQFSTKKSIAVTVSAMDQDELFDFVDAAAGNLIAYYLGEAGANKQVTIKNVKFTDPPSIDFVPDDGGGVAQVHTITGMAQWGASDTWALMIVHATKV